MGFSVRAPAGGLPDADNVLPSPDGVLIESRAAGDTQPRFRADAAGGMQFGSGAAGFDTSLARGAPGRLDTHDIRVRRVLCGTVGHGVHIAEGANARQGVATLSGGTVTISNTSVTASTRIQLTRRHGTADAAVLTVTAITPGASFSVGSSLATDTAVVHWLLTEPA
jgi:hypothetical protein